MTLSRCADCKSPGVRPHCPSSTCPWVTCAQCRSVTGFAYGQVRYIPGPGRKPMKDKP